MPPFFFVPFFLAAASASGSRPAISFAATSFEPFPGSAASHCSFGRSSGVISAPSSATVGQRIPRRSNAALIRAHSSSCSRSRADGADIGRVSDSRARAPTASGGSGGLHSGAPVSTTALFAGAFFAFFAGGFAGGFGGAMGADCFTSGASARVGSAPALALALRPLSGFFTGLSFRSAAYLSGPYFASHCAEGSSTTMSRRELARVPSTLSRIGRSPFPTAIWRGTAPIPSRCSRSRPGRTGDGGYAERGDGFPSSSTASGAASGALATLEASMSSSFGTTRRAAGCSKANDHPLPPTARAAAASAAAAPASVVVGAPAASSKVSSAESSSLHSASAARRESE